MGIISLIISILSISISVIVTGIPFYCKYIEKKTKIALIACDGVIRADMIRIVVKMCIRDSHQLALVEGAFAFQRTVHVVGD